jgi:hypothetical protein
MTVLSVWTTATRPASPSAGETGLNTTLEMLEVFNGSAWEQCLTAPAGLLTVADLAITDTSAGSVRAQGGFDIGVDDFRRVKILPQVGGSGAGGSQCFNINRVSSKSTDDYVFGSTWIVTHSGGTTVQSNGSVFTHVQGNAGPVWSLQNVTLTDASNASGATQVGFYNQHVRSSIPASAVGVTFEAAVIEARSQSGKKSSIDGVMRTLELDMFCADDDDLASGREIMPILIGKGRPSDVAPKVSSGIAFYAADAGSMIGTAYQVNMPFYKAAFTTLNGTQQAGANAIWLKDGHKIALSTSGNDYVEYESVINSVSFYQGATRAFSLNSAGAVLGVKLNLATYTVATLPTVTSASMGTIAFATNARNNGEAAGAGTGALVFVNNAGLWRAVWSGLAPTV